MYQHIYKGHRGKYCHENCNPWNDPKAKGVKTPVCEQLFNWVNKFTQVKSMNDPRFQMFGSTTLDYIICT